MSSDSDDYESKAVNVSYKRLTSSREKSKVDPVLLTYVGKRFRCPKDSFEGVVEAVVLETVSDQVCFSYRPLAAVGRDAMAIADGDDDGDDDDVKYLIAGTAAKEFEWTDDVAVPVPVPIPGDDSTTSASSNNITISL